MEKVTLKVKGMSCNHCVKTIEGSVGKLKGVSDVKVDLKDGTVDVQYYPNDIKIESITETIEEQGYSVN